MRNKENNEDLYINFVAYLLSFLVVGFVLYCIYVTYTYSTRLGVIVTALFVLSIVCCYLQHKERLSDYALIAITVAVIFLVGCIFI